MNEALARIRDATQGTRFEGSLYLVGGVLRDRELGIPVAEDVDLVLEGDSLELARFLSDKGLSDHHPVLYPRFGTAKLSVSGHDVELVSARAESYESDSRKPNVIGASLKDDAYRRDFTINTLMENIHTGELLDFTGRALADLKEGVIRTPLDPHITFFDDPLRMLRAIRFAARLGFSIDDATWAAMVEMSGRICLVGPAPPVVSAERIRDELNKVMATSGEPLTSVIPSSQRRGFGAPFGLELMRRAGLLEQFIPEAVRMVGVTQNAWHLFDVWNHTLIALSHAARDADIEVRLGILFHDVGKPLTRSEDEKGVHFYEHQFVGAEITRAILNRLKYTNDQIRDVTEMVSLHMRLGEARPEWTDSSMRRLIRAIHPYTDELFEITRCDTAAMRHDVPHVNLAAVRVRMDSLNAQLNVASVESPLDGLEMMALLGLPPGPWIRRAKEFLLNEVIEGRIESLDKEAARAVLIRWQENEAPHDQVAMSVREERGVR